MFLNFGLVLVFSWLLGSRSSHTRLPVLSSPALSLFILGLPIFLSSWLALSPLALGLGLGPSAVSLPFRLLAPLPVWCYSRSNPWSRSRLHLCFLSCLVCNVSQEGSTHVPYVWSHTNTKITYKGRFTIMTQSKETWGPKHPFYGSCFWTQGWTQSSI